MSPQLAQPHLQLGQHQLPRLSPLPLRGLHQPHLQLHRAAGVKAFTQLHQALAAAGLRQAVPALDPAPALAVSHPMATTSA